MDRLLSSFLLVFCILSTATITDAKDDPGCPIGYSSNDSKICYKIYTNPLSKSDAVKQCITDGAALSRVNDEEANSYINSLISDKKIKLLWLGIDCEGNTTECTYDEEGTVNYTNFYEENPSPVGSCVYMSGRSTTAGKWFLFDCSQDFSYVCEVEYGKQCPIGYKKYRSNCYKFVEEPATHIDAELTCRKDCGNLASVRSDSELSFVKSLSVNVTNQFRLIRIDNSTTAHIEGGYKDAQIGGCYGLSIKDGTGVKNKWSSVNCDVKMPFICQTGFKSIKSPCPADQVLVYTPVDCPLKRLKGAGTIYSPGWPASATYDKPYHCIYTIVTPPGTVAQVTFPVLSIPDTTSIKLYNDNSAASPFTEITSKTASHPSLSYKSTLNQMIVIVTNNATDYTKSPKNQWQINYKPAENIVLCPTNFTLFDDMCYGLVKTTTSVRQDAAQQVCEKYYFGSLASIKDEKTNEFLKSLMGMEPTENYMIGLVCYPYETCTWKDGITPKNYTKFVDRDTRYEQYNGYGRSSHYKYCTNWNAGLWTREYDSNCSEKRLICQTIPFKN